MNSNRVALFVAAAAFFASGAAAGADTPPAWAYVIPAPGLKPPADDGTIRRVPGSTVGYTLTQLRDFFMSADWHPGDYPVRPDVIARGRKPDLFACGVCHRADGPGGPENANLTGLPASYMVQQMRDFKSGARKSSVPTLVPHALKAKVAQNVTDEEMEIAAAYFAAIKPRSIVRVLEATTAPKTYGAATSYLVPLKTGESEPLGERIIEVPEDVEQFISRDTRARFVAYVPIGSIKRGQSLALTGGGGLTQQCATCHGADLKGLGPIPGIAGRSPTYMVRQLYDFKHGARAGAGSALMKATVDKLTIQDMIALAAYAASLPP